MKYFKDLNYVGTDVTEFFESLITGFSITTVHYIKIDLYI